MTVEDGRPRRSDPPLERRRFERERSAAGRESALLFGVALATFVLIAAVSIRQATSPGNAIGVIEDGVAATTEIDLLLGEHLAALQEQAREGGEETYGLPGYPIDVFLSRDELLKLDESGVRDLMLWRSAHVVYDEGLKAFDRTGNQEVSFLSLQGQMDFVLGNLTGERHSQSGTVAVLAGLTLAAMAIGALVTAEGYGGFRKLGLAVAGGAGFGLLLSGLAWLGAGVTASGDSFTTDLRDILKTLLAMPLRNYVVALAAGLLCALLSPLAGLVARFAAVTGERREPAEPLTEHADGGDWEPGAPV